MLEMLLTKKSAYNYHLPKHLIAQHPLHNRDECRLLHLERDTGQITHRTFKDILTLLKPTDIIVINTSKVIPARLIGEKRTGAKVETLLLREIMTNKTVSRWECLVKPANRLHVGDEVLFPSINSGEVLINGKIISAGEEGVRQVEFTWQKSRDEKKSSFFALIESIGQVPLPPYIKRDTSVSLEEGGLQEDKEYYQTVYADVPGSAAAPTAGMHFTEELLRKMKVMGIRVVPVILHIGIDTFRPVKVENILEHKMHREFCTISEETARIINDAKKNRQRIIAVGTTVTRTLESFTVQDDKDGFITSGSKWTDLFIYPGYDFKVIDGLLTNFHLPESSLLMLVSAFAGYEKVKKAYQQAVAGEYRFFSYGDAMLIL